MTRRLSFSARLTFTLALLLLAYGALVAVLGQRLAVAQERESLQRLSHGLAQHIVGHWPEITAPTREAADTAARAALLQMLMVVNPGVQVYVLGPNGEVQAYVGEPGMVRTPQVALEPIRAFLAGAALPLLGTDPMGSGQARLFSAAMFPPRAGDTQPPGYLYIVLDGMPHQQAAAPWNTARVWQGVAAVAAAGLLLALGVGALMLRRHTHPLRQLAQRMRIYQAATPLPARPGPAPKGDEITTLEHAFEDMTQRLETQTARERQLAGAHRETMAGVAHDLRTPLTALHGHLEAMAGQPEQAPTPQLLRTALAQSDKVRRLSQQLFELATLQSTDQLPQRERFSLDELVSDAVQKFDTTLSPSPVQLDGAPPGRMDVEGDWQLVERAVTNLIDNALRHAASAVPVKVQLWREGTEAHLVVMDAGPGLPQEVAERLNQGQSLREPPLARQHGGIGGLGLAIAQRVAQLHGGSLRPLSDALGGTRLCLALPLATGK
jgi:signal transduction histidine kinase